MHIRHTTFVNIFNKYLKSIKTNGLICMGIQKGQSRQKKKTIKRFLYLFFDVDDKIWNIQLFSLVYSILCKGTVVTRFLNTRPLQMTIQI